MIIRPEIVVHIYSGGEFIKARRIPRTSLEDFTREAERNYTPPVEVRVVA